MRTAIYILLVICALLMLVDYALMVVAHNADERAKKMARKWMEEHGDIVDNLTADTISADNITAKEMRDD